MFPHNRISPDGGDLATPTDPAFWTEAHALTHESAWMQRCESTPYSPPTSEQIIVDLASALQLGFRPRFAGSPAWARHLLRQGRASQFLGLAQSNTLATVHSLERRRAVRS